MPQLMTNENLHTGLITQHLEGTLLCKVLLHDGREIDAVLSKDSIRCWFGSMIGARATAIERQNGKGWRVVGLRSQQDPSEQH